MVSEVHCCAFAILVLSCNAADLINHGGSTKIFNVLDYNAMPGSQEDSTMAFMQAWDAACKFDGKAMLLIPPGVYILGETIFQGPCKGATPITIRLDGNLQALADISAYSNKGWISFKNIDGVVLTGQGTVDGQGPKLWKYNDCNQNPSCKNLPASIYMTKVQNARIDSIGLINSMGFHMHVTNSEHVLILGIAIAAPEDSPNTDGIHVSKSRDVAVTGCVIKTGDDCISFGQGSTNVTVDKVICGPGHGISVGSLGKLPDECDVQGLLVKNCTLTGTKNGVRIKTYPASGPSKASGIVFEDIVMKDVKNPIIIDQNYGSDMLRTQPSMVKISDVIYRNIRGTTRTPLAVNLMCSSKVPCDDIHLRDIDLKLMGIGTVISACNNVEVDSLGIQIPPPC